MLAFIVLALLGASACGAQGDFTGYNTSPVSYDSYDNAGSYSTIEKWPPSLALPSFGSCGGSSLLKPILAALIGAALLKLPFLIAAKVILLKLALPLGLLTAAAPLAVPLAYMFFSRGKDSTSSTPTPPTMDGREGRALQHFLDSSSCLERIACTIGRSHAKTPTSKTFSWMLKYFESMLGTKQTEARSKVGSYRSAYNAGATKGAEETCSTYKCDLPELIVRQGDSSYKLA